LDDELSLRLEALEAEIIQGKRAGVGDAASIGSVDQPAQKTAGARKIDRTAP
jgi:hypothetical protein